MADHPTTSNNETKLSRALSYLLRHGAVKEGLKIRPDGFVRLDEVLKHPKFQHTTVAEIEHIVKTNDKKRFTLIEEGGVKLIRANQGHSMPNVTQLETTQINSLDDIPTKCVVHGTYRHAWPKIKVEGLKTMGRNHIHFAIGTPERSEVISGMRKSCEVLIYIDVDSAIKDGVRFEMSANQVVLTAGVDGVLSTKYFACVVDAYTRKPFDPDFPKTLEQTLPWCAKSN